MVKRAHYLLIGVLLICSSSFAQFVEVATELGIYSESEYGQYGSGVSFFDFDHDGWDDITITEINQPIKAFRNVLGESFELAFVLPNDQDAKHPVWVDYDNDGDEDFFCTRNLASCLLYRNDGNYQFTDVSSQLNLPAESLPSFGCAWGDYDNDSYLDVYICNYNNIVGENWLLHNNGDGSFSDVTVELQIGGGTYTSFTPIWFDYDLDGDIDLFFTNDHHFGNKLYRNENGVMFTDVSESSGAIFPLDGMGAAMNDYDRDGDFDLYLTNTDDGSVLLTKGDSTYTNEIEGTPLGCEGTTSWGAVWLDYNNDMLDDIYVANHGGANSDQDFFFVNLDYTFYFDLSLGIYGNIYSSYGTAKGDFDHNGHYDIAVTEVNPAAVALWKNNNADGNWIKIGLTGTVSNHDAVGTIVKWYANGESRILQTMCGGNFLAQDSGYPILPMSSDTEMDSVIVQWPSGWIDTYYNLPANAFYAFTEGDSFQEELQSIQEVFVCENESISLSPGDYVSYTWNDGTTNSTLLAYNSGNYSVVVSNAFGVEATIHYNVLQHSIPPFNTIVASPSCNGFEDGSISLVNISDENVVVEFSGNALSQNQLDNVHSGEYTFQILSETTGCAFNVNVDVTEPLPLSVIAFADTVCVGQTTQPQIMVEGGVAPFNLTWDSDPSQQGEDDDATSENAFGTGLNTCGTEMFGGNYFFEVFDANGCQISSELNIVEFEETTLFFDDALVCPDATAIAEVDVTGGSPPYTFNWLDADPGSLESGAYPFMVMDAHECTSVDVFNVVEAAPMSFETTTNGDNAIVSIEGGISPHQFEVNGVMFSVEEIILEPGEYEISVTDAMGCTADTVLSFTNSIGSIQSTNFEVYPIPFSDVLNIKSKNNIPLSVYNAQGQLLFVLNKNAQLIHLDTSSWSEGIYFITDDLCTKAIVK